MALPSTCLQWGEFWAVICYPCGKKKKLRNQEISVPSVSTPVAREISGTSKDSFSPDVRPLQKHGPRCKRRHRKKAKSSILTDSPINDRIEQEALARAAVKKKYCKGAKNYRNKIYQKNDTKIIFALTLILITWTIRRAPTNASKWRMGFNPYPANMDNMASSYKC